MKKSIFFIAAVLSFLFSSCFLSQGNDDGKKTISIGFTYSGKTSQPYAANAESVKKAFDGNPRYQFTEMNAAGSISEQVNQIYYFVQNKVDFIIVDPVYEHGLKYAFENCFHNNIPVILCGGSAAIEPGLENRIIFEIRPDFYRETQLAARSLEIYEQGKVDVEILVLNDFADTTSARERNRAIVEEADKNEGWKIIARRETTGDYAKAKQLMEDVYLANPGLDAVFVESENDYQAVIDVLFKYGKMPGEDVLIFAFEDNDNLRKMILSGVLNYTVIEKQDAGTEISGVIEKIHLGKSYKKISLAEASGFYSNKSIEEKIVTKEKNLISRFFESIKKD